MMFQTMHKYFNNKIKMLLLLILMWTLMWQHVYGKSSTYDDDDAEVAAHVMAAGVDGNAEDDDVDGAFAVAGDDAITQDMIATDRANETMLATTRNQMGTTTTTNTATQYEDSNNNVAIYDHINENDNNSNKLPENMASNGNQQQQQQQFRPMAKLKVAMTSPPMEPKIMTKDQLNEIDYEVAPKDNKDFVCQGTKDDREQKSYGLKLSAIECDGQINVQHNLSKLNVKVFSDDILSDVDTKDFKNVVRKNDLSAHMQAEFIRQFARQKQLNRINLFTCRKRCMIKSCEENDENDDVLRNKQTMKLLELLYLGTSKTYTNADMFFLKVIYIDHLIDMIKSGSKNARGRPRMEDSYVRGTRNKHDPNWLNEVLPPENFRQIVIVDMSCGLKSQRLLEMASNKALFNSQYHWLLMEDYVFNRQTEIDDADDMKNKMNSGCSPTTKTTIANRSGSSSSSSSSFENQNRNSNNTDKEVVNDSTNSKSAMLLKKISSTSDVVGASASVSGKLNKRQLPLDFASTSSERLQGATVEGNTSATSGMGCGASVNFKEAGEDDMEIIEKFLGKLNININTELILAKRRMRGLIKTISVAPTSSSSSSSSVSQSIIGPSLANSASFGSSDYNTLEKMDYYVLYDVWNPGRQYNGQLNTSEIGYFSLQQGLKLDDWYTFASPVMRRMNMHLARIRCLIVLTHKPDSLSLEAYLSSHHDTHLDSMNRFNFALLSHVRALFNFSFILSKTTTWGYLKNGKFDGMIGALVRKQADIGGSPIFFRIERAKVIDHTTRTWIARPCFMFRHPRSTKKDRIVFLQPFSNHVWILLAACGAATILLLWVLSNVQAEVQPLTAAVMPAGRTTVGGFKNRLHHWFGLFCGPNLRNSNRRMQRIGLFGESTIFYVGLLCQQGLVFSTRSFSGRCIAVTSLLFSFAIYQFYSASIVGTLLMERTKTIRTLRDLVHSSLEIGIEDIVYNRDYFLRTKDPDALELYAKKVRSVPSGNDTSFADNAILPTTTETTWTEAQKAKSYRDILHSHESGAHAKSNDASNWLEPDYGVAKVKKGHFAFHVDSATAYKIIADTFNEKEICELMEIELFPPQHMVNVVQKGSPIRKILAYGLRRTVEVGLMDYQRKTWHSPKPRCVKQIHIEDLQVDMQTFSSALLVLLFGLLTSVLILTMELLHHRLRLRYTRRIIIT